MDAQYSPHHVEAEAQQYWDRHQSFKAVMDPDKEKFYCLTMFPYPSGHLHMGHVRNYTIGDVISRYQRMRGRNVLQPMGWDAFGLPAENAAIQNNAVPATWTYRNIDYMRQQLKMLGFAYDWDRELATCKPDYYRWEQWFFTELLKKDLAYRKKAAVNWCPTDQTVLANEQVHDGHCWRCDTAVERREIDQWFIRTTAKAGELLESLDHMPGWPDEVKAMQRNWIGRSQGVELTFDIKGEQDRLTVYTTRPDTLYGVSYMALAPQHPLTRRVADTSPELAAFVASCQQMTTSEANMATMEKRGMDTGLTAIHPLTGEEIPVWAANFVLMEYGSGAVMSVPAHDERDWEFARQYGLPIRPVIAHQDSPTEAPDIDQGAFSDKGVLINSDKYTGMTSDEAFKAIADNLNAQGRGEVTVQYRLRDWGVSRQRYWGAPIPVVYVDGTPEAAEDIPVILPENVTFSGIQSPLNQDESFRAATVRGKAGVRETDTFDTFMESSWYFARFATPDYQGGMLEPEEANYWLPVDQYVGGIEHATMHLMYSRFVYKVMRDMGLVDSDEPFTNLLCQGMVLAESYYKVVDGVKEWVAPNDVTVETDEKGQIVQARQKSTGDTVVYAGMSKMSKSKNNGVDPQQAIEQYGADTVRLFSMFAAPPEQTLEWVETGVQGAHKFLNRLWRAVHQLLDAGNEQVADTDIGQDKAALDLRHKAHSTLAKVTDDFDRRQTYNTAVAAVMELLNAVYKADLSQPAQRAAVREALEISVLVLAPVVPHITHQLWYALGHSTPVIDARWPTVDESALARDTLTYAVQVNGKVRAQIEVAADAEQADIEAAAQAEPNVQKFTAGKSVRRVIVVPKKLVNIVVG